MRNTIFVYGTLQRGMLEQIVPQINPCIQFGEKGYVNGRLYDLGDYPGACPSQSADEKVYGQLVTISSGFEKKVLEELDAYEDFHPLEEESSLFIRRQEKVFIKHALVVTAWIYWYNKPVNELKRIQNGIYKTGYIL